MDGGFARNPLFLQNLIRYYSDAQIRTMEVPHATTIRALIHLELGEACKKMQSLFG